MTVETRYAPAPDPDWARVVVATLIGGAFAGTVLWFFADLYLFAKVLHVQPWMEAWAPARFSGGVAVFAGLLPATLLPRTAGGAAKATVAAAAIAPVPAVVKYASQYIGDALWVNAAFQYFWVLAWACAIPVGLLFALQFVARAADQRSGR